VIVCHVCGTNNPDGTKFCEGCGVELQASSAPAAAVPAATTPVVAPAEAAPSAGVTVQETLQGQLSASDVVPDPSMPVMTPAITTDPAPVAAEAPAEAPAIDASSTALATPEAVPPVVPDVPSATEIDASVAAAAAAIVPQASVSGTAPANARLLPRQFGALGNTAFPLNGVRLSVGRFDPSTGPVDIDLSGMPGESHVSRRHGEMYLENGKWMVRDLGSTNGIYVKHPGDASFGPRLQSPQELTNGDEIAFGNVMFVYQDDSGGAPA
jgi:FHA domain